MPVQRRIQGGYDVVVDEVDADLLDPRNYGGRWFVNSRGYVVRTKPQSERLHRTIMERKIGRPLKDGELVDHVDGDPLHNIRDNLRLADRSQNQRNRGPSGDRRYKGVYRSQAQKAGWVAKITHRGDQLYLGTYPTPETAARAYDRACKRLHGEYARPNFTWPTQK